MKTILIILFFYTLGFAQLKPFILLPINSINDTTNNYYVTTTGTDTASGAYANPFSIAKADTFFNYENKDSVFFLSGTYDTNFTARHAGVTYCSYDLNNKPIFYGADTVKNWSFVDIVDTQYDTNSVNLSNTTYTSINQSYSIAWRIPITTHGYLYGYILRMGVNNSNAKLCLGTRNNDTIYTITDSCIVSGVAFTGGALNTAIYGDNGKYISQDSIWVVASFSTTVNVPYGDSWGGGLSYFLSGWVSGTYNNFPATHYVKDNLGGRLNIPIGIIVKNSINQGDTSKFYAVFPDTIYQVQFNNILGNHVVNKDSVNSIRDWFAANDSIWVYEDTTLIEATVRDGITTNDSVIVAGFDIRKTRYGIFNNSTNDVQIGQSVFKQNQCGILDTGTGIGFYRNNIFNNNTTHIWNENKDTSKIYNNTFYNSDGDSTHVSNYFADSKIKFRGNAVYTGLPKVAVIDNAANIVFFDYNGFAYNYGVDGSFLKIETAYYDSLAQLVSQTIFGDNSFHVGWWIAYPYNDFRFTDIGSDFTLRHDTIVSPLINSNIALPGVVKDVIGNFVPDALSGLHDMGAYETVLTDNPPSAPTNLIAILHGDSTWLNFNYTYESDLDSIRKYVNSSWNSSVAFASTVYHHPARSGSNSLPTVTQLNVTDIATTSATLNFYIKPNNDTTYVRARYGIGSFTDSTASTIQFIFIPQATNYYIRLVDTSGQISGISNIAALTWTDSIYVSIGLTGLTNAQTYMVDVTASNDNGWVNSSDASFTTGSSVPSDFYITPLTDDVDATNDTITYPQLQAGYVLQRAKNYTFEKGKTYNGNWTPLRDTCTVEAGRITINSNGTGLKPIITLKGELPGWTTSGNWSVVSGYTNIWVMDFICSVAIDRLWLDNVEVKEASHYNLRSWYMENLLAGDNGDGTIGVCPTHQFFNDYSAGEFYLYSPSNPATYYSSIQYPGKVENGVVTKETLLLEDADYITIDGLDIQGGMWASIGLGGSDYVKIVNCNIGKNSNREGIHGDLNAIGWNISTDKTSSYVEIANDSINSYWDWDYVFYTARLTMGVVMGGDTYYWDVHDNYFIDWEWNITVDGHYGHSMYHNIYKNDISSPQCSYSKAIQISEESAPAQNPTYVNFYNNYIHDVTFGMQIHTIGNKFFYNIFNVNKISTMSHNLGGGGWILGMQADVFGLNADSNYFFNNTNYNSLDYISPYQQDYTFFYNNLNINCGINVSGIAIRTNIYPVTFKNNLYYYSSKGTSDDMLQIQNIANYTVNEWNALNGQYNKTISGELQYVGNIGSLINTSNFTLPNGSMALNAGINIDILLPALFEDRFGNVVNQNLPNIGSCDNNP